MGKKFLNFVLLLPLFLVTTSCGETDFGKDVSFEELKTKFNVEVKSVVASKGSVKITNDKDSDYLLSDDFEVKYYEDAVSKKEKTNKNVSTDTLSVVTKKSGIFTTTTYDYVSKTYTAVNGKVSFVPSLSALLDKVNLYTTKAEGRKADALIYTCKEKAYVASFDSDPITVNTESKLKLCNIKLVMDETKLTTVAYVTQVGSVKTSYEVNYTYGTLTEFDGEVPTGSEWKESK